VRRNKRSLEENRRHAVHLPHAEVEVRRAGVVVQDEAVLAALSGLGYMCPAALSNRNNNVYSEGRTDLTNDMLSETQQEDYHRRLEKARLVEAALLRLLG
jgi:hypothetical protein